MTLQQLKYVIAVADTGTLTKAAKQLFISQPSLTNSIHALEKEMNIEIFRRTNKGIVISKEGEEFLGYARQVLELVLLDGWFSNWWCGWIYVTISVRRNRLLYDCIICNYFYRPMGENEKSQTGNYRLGSCNSMFIHIWKNYIYVAGTYFGIRNFDFNN